MYGISHLAATKPLNARLNEAGGGGGVEDIRLPHTSPDSGRVGCRFSAYSLDYTDIYESINCGRASVCFVSHRLWHTRIRWSGDLTRTRRHYRAAVHWSGLSASATGCSVHKDRETDGRLEKGRVAWDIHKMASAGLLGREHGSETLRLQQQQEQFKNIMIIVDSGYITLDIRRLAARNDCFPLGYLN
jgi:hypothetical protein